MILPIHAACPSALCLWKKYLLCIQQLCSYHARTPGISGASRSVLLLVKAAGLLYMYTTLWMWW